MQLAYNIWQRLTPDLVAVHRAAGFDGDTLGCNRWREKQYARERTRRRLRWSFWPL